MRSWSILVVLGAAGCGSYWDLPKGEELPYGCAGELNWYVDTDGDNFGDPLSLPEVSCDPVTGRAPNALDCDDQDAAITGRIGTICPVELGAGEYQTGTTGTGDPIYEYLSAPSTCNSGVVIEGVEYVGTCGDVRMGFTQAATTCLHWAGWPEDGSDGLALIDSPSGTLEGFLNGLDGQIGDFGAWIDVRWEPGTDPLYDGSWVLGSGAPADAYPLCQGSLTPADFWPDVNFNDPVARDNVESVVPDLRLALLKDGDNWCMGVPPTGRVAFPLCQRPAPSGLDYEESAEGATTSE